MSVIVPSYAFTYVRIGYLKNLIMDDGTLQKLKRIKKIKEFIEFIKPYYPGLDVKEFTIEDIEKAIYHIYIKLIGRLMLISPHNMRNFLRVYLLRYEIMNVKQIILGTIVGMSANEKSININFLVEKYLENTDFIKKIIEIQNLDEIQLYLKGSKYERAVKEGLLYFHNKNEIFVLESFLDRIYYESLLREKHFYGSKEKLILHTFIDFTIEIYNIIMIYRGIINNIDRDLLAQFIIYDYLFLDFQKLSTLINQETTDDFLNLIEFYFKKDGRLSTYLNTIQIKKEHFIWSIEALYLKYFFKKNILIIGDIEYLTIFKITELLIKKEREIKFNIIPNVVKIIHKKYEQLEPKA